MQAYLQAAQPYLLPGLVAFILSLVLVKLALILFPKWGLMDRPHLYGHKRAPIPYSGGLAIFLAFLMCVVLFLDFDKHLIGLLIGASMIVGVSFLDDRYQLSPFLRLGVQVLAALTIIVSGIGVTHITNPLGGVIQLDAYQIPITLGDTIYHFTVLADLFTILWIVAVINTFNWLDGLPGLVSGMSTIGALVIFILSIRPNFHYIDQTQVALLSIIVAGIAFAFWFFDFYPPKILMGDTGSMFFGFMLAVLAIFSGGKIATAVLIMGFPILDAGWVIVRRLWQGKSPFKGDLYHFHHRLLKAGLNERHAILFIYFISAVFGGTALFLGSEQKLIALIVLLLLMAGVGVWVVFLERRV